jgi:hypothetical protein
MEAKVVKAYLSNSPVAGDCVLANGVVTVTGWFPIIQNQVISAIIKNAVVEVRQYNLVSAAANIVAFSKYQVAVGNTGNRREGAQNQLAYFGYTAPAVLTGVAATDKYNAYISIAYKINKTSSARAIAGSEVTIATGSITGGPFTQYEIVIGGTSGAMGYFISGASSPLTLAVFTPNAQFVSGEVLTGQTSGATATTSAAPTLGIYMSAYTQGFFQGPNTVLVTAGFQSTDLTLVNAGVISYGIGSNLQYFIPRDELLSNNLNQGLFSYPFTQTVNTAVYYTFYSVTDSIPVRNNAAAGTTAGAQRNQVFYASNGSATTTPPSAFNTAFETNFPTYQIV